MKPASGLALVIRTRSGEGKLLSNSEDLPNPEACPEACPSLTGDNFQSVEFHPRQDWYLTASATKYHKVECLNVWDRWPMSSFLGTMYLLDSFLSERSSLLTVPGCVR